MSHSYAECRLVEQPAIWLFAEQLASRGLLPACRDPFSHQEYGSMSVIASQMGGLRA
jgi:hypothetical protein